ncbi:MAG: hypothetical protein ACREJI_02280 [Candidatus Methylomirabilales bacterium]
MRTLIALCLLSVMVLGLLAAPAEAGGKFGVGFATGAATVFFLHHISHPHVHYHAVPYYRVYYAPPPVYYYYAPQPVYYAPAPSCRSVWIEGVWREAPRDQGGGFTAYYREWVPGRWQQVCP